MPGGRCSGRSTARGSCWSRPTGWPCWTRRSTFPTASSAMRSTSTGRSCRAGCTALGVTCSDCHDPHSGRIRAPGNALCARCHLATKYDDPSHHHHRAGTVEAQCVSCHMPTRNYMVVHARLDHSIRVPRPDLSARLGTPDACSTCHAGKSAAWAAAATAKWYGHVDSVTVLQRYAEAIQAGRANSQGAAGLLVAVAADTAIPPIARATTISLMGGNAGPQTLTALQNALSDPAPRVRRSAVEVVEAVDPKMRLQMAFAALTDSVRSVRLAAVSALASVPAALWSPEQRQRLRPGRGRVPCLPGGRRRPPRVPSQSRRSRHGARPTAEAGAEYRTALQLSHAVRPGLGPDGGVRTTDGPRRGGRFRPAGRSGVCSLTRPICTTRWDSR